MILFGLKRVTACSFAHGRAISCGRLACIVYKDIIEVGSCRDTNISDGAGLSRKTHSAYASVGGCSGKFWGKASRVEEAPEFPDTVFSGN